jgi:hypothetical protein
MFANEMNGDLIGESLQEQGIPYSEIHTYVLPYQRNKDIHYRVVWLYVCVCPTLETILVAFQIVFQIYEKFTHETIGCECIVAQRELGGSTVKLYRASVLDTELRSRLNELSKHRELTELPLWVVRYNY